MGLSLAGPLGAGSVPKRVGLFGLMVATGWLGGMAWGVEASRSVYDGFLQVFVDPALQIPSLGMALVLGFLVGFIHIACI